MVERANQSLSKGKTETVLPFQELIGFAVFAKEDDNLLPNLWLTIIAKSSTALNHSISHIEQVYLKKVKSNVIFAWQSDTNGQLQNDVHIVTKLFLRIKMPLLPKLTIRGDVPLPFF